MIISLKLVFSCLLYYNQAITYTATICLHAVFFPVLPFKIGLWATTDLGLQLMIIVFINYFSIIHCLSEIILKGEPDVPAFSTGLWALLTRWRHGCTQCLGRVCLYSSCLSQFFIYFFFKVFFGAFWAFMIGTETDWKGGREGTTCSK